MMTKSTLLACFLLFVTTRVCSADELLEIHYINVGQGGGTLIIGPDGTTIVYDFGNLGKGEEIANYLETVVGIDPEDGVDYTIVSHRDQDHYGGFKSFIEGGYDVKIANFDSGSTKLPTTRMRNVWLKPAARTTAGEIVRLPPGLKMSLGNGATLQVVAANGRIYGHDREEDGRLPSRRNENDRSVAIYIKYGNFDYILDGDMGAGENSCSGRQTTQKDFQLPMAKQLVKLGMKEEFGVDVMHVSHHGSESSTSQAYYNIVKPEVGLISVGLNQRTFWHPRVDVVKNVLLGPDRPDCDSEREQAPPLRALFQTDIGKEGQSSTGRTSFAGMHVGDIKLTTDGVSEYRISASGRIEGNVEACRPMGSESWVFPLDETISEAAGITGAAEINKECAEDPSTCGCNLQLN